MRIFHCCCQEAARWSPVSGRSLSQLLWALPHNPADKKMQRSLLVQKASLKSCSYFLREVWHWLCLGPWPLLCSHQSAPLLHESLPCSSSSISIHSHQCIHQCLDGFQCLEFRRFLCPYTWSSSDSDLLFKESWSISQVDYSRVGRFQRLYERETPFWQANCPLKRQIYQSWACLGLRVADHLWQTYMLPFAHNMDTFDEKKWFLFTTLFMPCKLGKSTKWVSIITYYSITFPFRHSLWKNSLRN